MSWFVAGSVLGLQPRRMKMRADEADKTRGKAVACLLLLFLPNLSQ